MRTFIALALFAAITFPAFAAEPKAPETNVVFRNATIHDGTGKPPVKGDVHVKGDKIAAVGKVGKIDGATEIDATGLIVCPGFIDLHTHCDSGLTGKTGRANKNYLTQGCTTVVTGNCGSGPVDAGEVLQDARRAAASAPTSSTSRRTTASAPPRWATRTARRPPTS